MLHDVYTDDYRRGKIIHKYSTSQNGWGCLYGALLSYLKVSLMCIKTFLSMKDRGGSKQKKQPCR